MNKHAIKKWQRLCKDIPITKVMAMQQYLFEKYGRLFRTKTVRKFMSRIEPEPIRPVAEKTREKPKSSFKIIKVEKKHWIVRFWQWLAKIFTGRKS